MQLTLQLLLNEYMIRHIEFRLTQNNNIAEISSQQNGPYECLPFKNA
jgi:hypothetical protein